MDDEIKLTIINVSDIKKITKLTVVKELSIKELKERLQSEFEPKMKLIYCGKLLEDSIVLSSIIKQDEASIHLVGKSKFEPEPEQIMKEPEIKEPAPTKEPLVFNIPVENKEPLTIFDGCFSKHPINDQIVTINGMLYSIKTGPPQIHSQTLQEPLRNAMLEVITQLGNRRRNRAHINAEEAVPDVPGRVVLRRRIVINMDMVWLSFKLGIALYFLGYDQSWTRIAFLSVFGIAIFLLQSGLITLPSGGVRPPVVPNPDVNVDVDGDANQPDETPANQNQVPENTENPVPIQRTLLGLLTDLATSFFASMIPEQQPRQAVGDIE